jgi:hypothetical protein
MARRAAICIGVNHAGTMLPLQAAVKGAQDFGAWAVSQGCDTKVLVDSDTTRVGLIDVFDAVQERVSANVYEQLIIYFSGHGILNAPGVEFWLLSRAPENANEAVNLYRSIEDARNCGIPHVVFISDACRSSVSGPPLSGVSGGTVFPNRGFNPSRGEVDVFYATRPGDPAWELPQPQATGNYRGVFTEFLLDTVKLPEEELVEQIGNPAPLSVIASRKLKPLLESIVPSQAAALDVRIRQTPEIQVGTALPKYFAAVDAASIQRRARGVPLAPSSPPASLDAALSAIRGAEVRGAKAPPPRDVALAAQLGLTAEVARLQAARGLSRFETHTGFTLHGAAPIVAEAPGWKIDPAFQDGDAWHWRFAPAGRFHASSAVLRYSSNEGMRGTVVAVLPEFIGSVVVDPSGRVVSVNYVPSANSWRFAEYQRREAAIEKMKSFAAVAARHGRFEVPSGKAADFAERIRQDKGLDPVLGLYAAYAYAQAGRNEDVFSVFKYMRDDTIPVPFDVVMLALRYQPPATFPAYAPFVPMLTQGWALVAAGDPLFRPIHQVLRAQLIPSLWTTLTEEGADEALRYLIAESQP